MLEVADTWLVKFFKNIRAWGYQVSRMVIKKNHDRSCVWGGVLVDDSAAHRHKCEKLYAMTSRGAYRPPPSPPSQSWYFNFILLRWHVGTFDADGDGEKVKKKCFIRHTRLLTVNDRHPNQTHTHTHAHASTLRAFIILNTYILYKKAC